MTVTSTKRAITTIAIMLSACSQKQASPDKQKGIDNLSVASVVSSEWNPPPASSAKVRDLMGQWDEARDGCQGGINVRPDDPICKKRDDLQDRLRKAGWCFGAPMDKGAADADWHQCGRYDSDDMPNLGADVQRGKAALAQDGGAQTPADKQRSDKWAEEEAEKDKYPVLAAYEKSVEKTDTEIGLAKVLIECHIRGEQWYQQTMAMLESRRQQPSVREMRDRLAPSSKIIAARFEEETIEGEQKWLIGEGSKRKDCRSIAEMPFVSNGSAFQ